MGRKTQTGKVITAKGVKPTVEVQWGRENFWGQSRRTESSARRTCPIYGAIEPLTGSHFLHEYPKLNGDYFQQFLDWLSQQLGDEEAAILQLDQASAHMTSALRWPENIIPLPRLRLMLLNLTLPTRLWQLLKQPLHNELFSSLQALAERVQQLFDQLTLEQVISVSSYNFILEALFYAALH